MRLSSGIIIFLFTDIDGPTRLAQDNPDKMPAHLALHHKML